MYTASEVWHHVYHSFPSSFNRLSAFFRSQLISLRTRSPFSLFRSVRLAFAKNNRVRPTRPPQPCACSLSLGLLGSLITTPLAPGSLRPSPGAVPRGGQEKIGQRTLAEFLPRIHTAFTSELLYPCCEVAFIRSTKGRSRKGKCTPTSRMERASREQMSPFFLFFFCRRRMTASSIGAPFKPARIRRARWRWPQFFSSTSGFSSVGTRCAEPADVPA